MLALQKALLLTDVKHAVVSYATRVHVRMVCCFKKRQFMAPAFKGHLTPGGCGGCFPAFHSVLFCAKRAPICIAN